MSPLLPEDPRALGSYRFLGRLGAGGMGRVYLARSPGGRTVAVKVVRSDLAEDAEFRARFRREVESARLVPGRFTAPVVDADVEGQLPWLATRYVTGPALSTVVERHGPLPEHTVRAMGAGLTAALADIHAAGLVHRDLKPSNVLLAADGPRVIDFGIARAVDGDRMTRTGMLVGSPGFMPPEQALGRQVGQSGDVFALGVVLAFAVTGRNVFGQGAPAGMLYQVVHEEPDMTDVPKGLAALIGPCLAKDPEARPAPGVLLDGLAPGADGDGIPDEVFANWLPGEVASTIAAHASRVLDLDVPQEGTAVRDDTEVDGRATGGAVAPGDRSGTSGTVGPSGSGGPSGTGGSAGPGSAAEPDDAAPDGTATRPVGRRRLLAVGGGVLGLAAVGGGTAALLGRDGAGGAGGSGGSGGGKARPKPGYSTPPPGVAPQPLWKVAVHNRVSPSPAVLRGHVYICPGDSIVEAYDLRTHRRVWKKELGAVDADTGFVHADGVLYFGSDVLMDALVGVKAGSHDEVWRSRLPETLKPEAPVATDGRRLYMIGDAASTMDDYLEGDTETAMCAVDLKTRKKVWEHAGDRGDKSFSELVPAVGNGHLAYGDGHGSLTVRETAKGRRLWTKKPFGASDYAPRPLIVGDLVVVHGEVIQAFELTSGREAWKVGPKGRKGFRGPALIEGKLYAYDLEGGLWCVDPRNGRELWRAKEDLEFPGEGMVKIRDTLYSASEYLGVIAVDAADGRKRWTFDDDESEDWSLAASRDRLVALNSTSLLTFPAL